MCYFGTESEFIQKLIDAIPLIEQKFAPIEIHLGCRDSVHYIFEEHPRIHKHSIIKEAKRNFAYVRELKHNFVENPIDAFLIECELEKL